MSALNLTASEAGKIAAAKVKLSSSESGADALESYLLHVRTLEGKDQAAGWAALPEIEGDAAPASKVAKDFFKRQTRFETYEYKQKQKALARLAKDGVTGEEAERIALQIARTKRKGFEKLFQACKTKCMTPAHEKAAKTFGKFIIGVNMASTAITYGGKQSGKLQKALEEPDAQTRYYKMSVWTAKLGYEMFMSYITQRILARIVADPTMSGVEKQAKSFKYATGISLANSRLYGGLFGAGGLLSEGADNEAERKLKELETSPEFQQDVQEIMQSLEKEGMFQRAVQSLSSAFGGDITATDIDSDSITPEDLKDPEIRELLQRGISAREYQDIMGDWLRTGDTGMDRWVFHNAWAQIARPEGMWVNAAIYELLCRGVNDPVRSLAVSLTAYAVNKVLVDGAFYSLRDKAINM